MTTILIDAQLSPSLANWISERFGVSTHAARDLGLREAQDYEIFQAARRADAIVMTKDADFPHLLSQHGPPPRVIWLTCGNTSNRNLRKILDRTFETAIEMIKGGEILIEVSEAGAFNM